MSKSKKSNKKQRALRKENAAAMELILDAQGEQLHFGSAVNLVFATEEFDFV